MEAGNSGSEEAKQGEEKAEPKPAPKEPKDSPKAPNRRKLRRWLIVLALVVALVTWVATRGDGDDSSESASPETSVAQIVSVEELQEVAADSDHPIYWAGPIAGAQIELTGLAGGGEQVRYLAEEGEDSTDLPTIGSYPLADPTAALAGYAQQPDAIVRQADDGRQVVTSTEQPTSVYFASLDNSVQVEVYDASPDRALSLALSGEVRPVD